jgi:hypothetical protein
MQFIGIAILLSFPIFYFYGIYSFFKKAHNNQLTDLPGIIAALKNYLGTVAADKNAAQLRKALKLLESTQNGSAGETPVTSFGEQTGMEAAPLGTETEVAQPEGPSATSRLLSDSNTLLYLGAFLLLVSASIFVSFSYETFSGLAKVLLVLGSGGLFYLSGILLYTQTKLFKPAGVTFTSIGLLLFPLSGLATYTYIFNQQNGELVWFGTSVLLIIAYWLALFIIRNSLLAYLALFTVVSLVASLVSLFTVPLYYLGWVGVLMAAVFLVLKKYSVPEDPLLNEPLGFTTRALVACSLGISLFLIDKEGYLQFSVQSFLVAVYSALFAVLADTDDDRRLGIWASVTAIPVAVASGLHAYYGSYQVGAVMTALSVVGIGYVASAELAETSDRPKVSQALLYVGVALLVITSFLGMEKIALLWRSLWVLLGAAVWLTWRRRSAAAFLLAEGAVLLLPAVAAELWHIKMISLEISLLYALVTSVLVTVRWFQKKNGDSSWEFLGQASVVGYGLGMLCLAGILVAAPVVWWSVALAVVLVLLSMDVAYIETLPEVLGGTVLLWMYTIFQVVRFYSWSTPTGVALLAVSGIIWTAAAYLIPGLLSKTRHILRLAGVLLLAVGVGVRFLGSEPNWWSIICLVLIAASMFLEDVTAHKKEYAKFILAVLLLACQWVGWDFGEIREILFYSLGWAAYFAGLALASSNWQVMADDEQAVGSESDSWTVLALMFLTIPLAVQGLDNQVRGVVLMGIDLLLIAGGMLTRRKLVWQWGAGMLVLQVLYYLRDFLLGIPTWAVFGGIGLAVLTVALWMLSKQKHE